MKQANDALSPQALTCKDCNKSMVTTAYPMLRCTLLGEYVAPTFHCCRLEAVKK